MTPRVKERNRKNGRKYGRSCEDNTRGIRTSNLLETATTLLGECFKELAVHLNRMESSVRERDVSHRFFFKYKGYCPAKTTLTWEQHYGHLLQRLSATWSYKKARPNAGMRGIKLLNDNSSKLPPNYLFDWGDHSNFTTYPLDLAPRRIFFCCLTQKSTSLVAACTPGLSYKRYFSSVWTAY